MRLSCNGCRVLRRGCNPDCPIRACLQWMNSPESESNATLFLAKFYGRAGLFNLLSAAPPQLQPAVFKSLLYEACGRIVNPVFGSTGLLSTGRWQLCEAAVKAVLSGAPIEQQALDGAVSQLQACDIRHVAKSGGKSCGPDRLQRGRSRMKRRAGKLKAECSRKKVERGSVSGDSTGSGVSEHRSVGVVVEADSTSSPVDEDLELELTLGWGPLKRSGSGTVESRD